MINMAALNHTSTTFTFTQYTWKCMYIEMREEEMEWEWEDAWSGPIVTDSAKYVQHDFSFHCLNVFVCVCMLHDTHCILQVPYSYSAFNNGKWTNWFYTFTNIKISENQFHSGKIDDDDALWTEHSSAWFVKWTNLLNEGVFGWRW